MFSTPYPRPTEFSDPHGEHEPEVLKALLATRDEDLTADQLSVIFQPHLSAGTYDEAVYFLPIAMQFLCLKPIAALILLPGIMQFLDENEERMVADDLANRVRRSLLDCFDRWTKDFVVIDQAQANLKRGTVKMAGGAIVQSGDAVVCIVEELCRFSLFLELAQDLVQRLASQMDNPVASAWFLELACGIRQRQICDLISAKTLQRISDQSDMVKKIQQRLAETTLMRIQRFIRISEDGEEREIDLDSAEGRRALDSIQNRPELQSFQVSTEAFGYVERNTAEPQPRFEASFGSTNTPNFQRDVSGQGFQCFETLSVSSNENRSIGELVELEAKSEFGLPSLSSIWQSRLPNPVRHSALIERLIYNQELLRQHFARIKASEFQHLSTVQYLESLRPKLGIENE
jgi:hypothetical protein